MPEFNFKLSDSAKYNLIFNAINQNFTEEGNWTIDYAICDVYDDYALCYNYENGSYVRAYYTKGDSTVEIGEIANAYVIDVSEAELNALNLLKELNGGSFEKIDEAFELKANVGSQIETLESEKAELNQQKVELEATLATLKTENETLTENINTAVENYNALNIEVEELRSFKAQAETEVKTAVIAKYTEKVQEEVLAKYTENLDNYTVESLEKELAYEMVKNNPSIFTKKEEPAQPSVVLKDNNTNSGIEAILSKHKK